MPSLKDLRNRIASVKSTQKITKAMQMVAVSKLRRAQAAAEAARPYADKVEAVLGNLAAAGEVREHGLDLIGEGPRGFGGDLGAAQLRRRDHLHRLGDLLRRFDGGDPVSEVL